MLLFKCFIMCYYIIGDFMNTKKRFFAFLLDMFLVLILATSLSNLDYLNPYKDKYENAIKKYNDAMSEYGEVLLTTNSKNSLKDTLNFLKDKMIPPMMEVSKYNLFNSLWYLIIFFLYNVLFAYYNGGQTLGKKVFKIKVVDKGEDKVSFKNLTLRSLFNGSSLFFGVNIIVIIRILISLIPNEFAFMFLIYLVEIISVIYEVIVLISLFTSKGARLTNDIIAKTEVIEVK